MYVLAPDISLGALIHQGDLERVHRNNAGRPGRRHAVLGNRQVHAEKVLRVHFVTAPFARLQGEEEARIAQSVNILLRHHPLLARLRSVLAQHIAQRQHTVVDILGTQWRAVGQRGSGQGHGVSPTSSNFP